MAEEKTKGIVEFIKASKRHLAAVIVIVILIVALGSIPVFHYFEEDARCGEMCHNHQEFYDKYQDTLHQKAGVKCVGCHNKPFPLGWAKSMFITNSVNMYKFYIVGGKYRESFDVLKEQEPIEKFVPPNKNCVKSQCHRDMEYTIEGDKGTVLWPETHTTDPKVNCVVCHGNVMLDEPAVYPEALPPG